MTSKPRDLETVWLSLQRHAGDARQRSVLEPRVALGINRGYHSRNMGATRVNRRVIRAANDSEAVALLPRFEE